ncbi:hypothetical protein K439DRAFT_1662643 [Ramaria rubella]|nr:hypothetical protein K439DRAFT_1662643 [Ramaria rubella]
MPSNQDGTRLTDLVFISITVLLFALSVNADTSLWIPGVDGEQPLSAGLLGVGTDRRTTWQLQQGSPTGTFTDPADFGFPGTATLVEGPNDAFFTLSVDDPAEGTLALGFSCTVSSSIAVCLGQAAGSGVGPGTTTETQTVSPFLVQGGGTVSGPAVTTAAGGPAQPSGSSSQAGSSSSQASAGSTRAPSPAQPTTSPTNTQKNVAQTNHVAGGFIGLLAGIVFAIGM